MIELAYRRYEKKNWFIIVQFEGFFNGKWAEPTPGKNSRSVFVGVDTHSFKWGSPPSRSRRAVKYPNELSFVTDPFSTQLNEKFKVGDLIYFNGESRRFTDVESVPLDLGLELYDPIRRTESFDIDFDIDATPNNKSPEENADSISPINKVTDSFFKYKGENYTIRLLGFSQDKGQTLTQEFRVLENARTIAGLYARIELDKGIGTDGEDKLTGTDRDERLDGKGGNDKLIAREGDDILIGGGGKDTLNGGCGDDDLYGGAGNDILTGSTGADKFIYETGRDFQKQDIGEDKIVDFMLDEDTIVLYRTTFSKIESLAGSTLQEFEVVDSKNAAMETNAFIVYDQSNGDLYYNQNGSDDGFGSGGLFARLRGSPALEAANFSIYN